MERRSTATRRRAGFTLLELVIVVLIIGILMVLALPLYNKAVETSKADDAIALVQMVGTANRMYYMDKGKYLNGSLNGCSPSGTCAPGNTDTNACRLMWCNFLGKMDLSNRPYTVYTLGSDTQPGSAGICGISGPSANNYVACAKRNGGSDPFNTWGYTADVNGKVEGWPISTPDKSPPKPPL